MDKLLLLIAVGFFCNHAAFAVVLPKPDLIVAADGSGDFKTIQAALDTIPKTNSERIVVLIKGGIYHEKIRVDAPCVTLRGEGRTVTQIEFPQDDTAFNKSPDTIGRAVINVNQADDFVLDNLTVENTAGVIGPHAMTIFSTGDRGVVVNCNVLSHGADTVAFWRKDAGRTYHANCHIEGSVDFVCPHGWCYATNCTFYEMKDTAAMWHDGSKNKDMKFVLRDCRFDGAEGWNLARHHHDAQFYFLDCRFSRTMIDRPPFRVIYPLDGGKASAEDIQRNKDLDKSNIWGERSYYFHCHRDGGDYAWFADNLASAPGAPKPEQMNAAWTFGGTWNPENTAGPTITNIINDEGLTKIVFSEKVTVKGKPKWADGRYSGDYISGSGSDTLVFHRILSPIEQSQGFKVPTVDLNGGFIVASEAGVTTRMADLSLLRIP